MKNPEIIFMLCFVHRDSDESDSYEHTSLEDARYHMALFNDSNADIYDRIELYRRDYTGHTDTLLETRHFSQRRSL